MSTIIEAGTAKLAGLQIDTLQKVRSGQITLDQWERFNNLSPADREARFGYFQKKPNSFLVQSLDFALTSWRRFYLNFFGIGIDIKSIKIPQKNSGFDQFIVVSKGITLNQIVEVCRKQFRVWVYTEDLDSNVTENDRMNTETYAIWVRDRIEADEENRNLSANDCKEKDIQGETLMERLLHEQKYFAETGKHLDVKNVTLCSGSRNRDGDVPVVNWLCGHPGLDVGRCSPAYRGGNLRSRSVVS